MLVFTESKLQRFDEQVIIGYESGAELAKSLSKAVDLHRAPGEIISQASLSSQTFAFVKGSPEIPLIFLQPVDGGPYYIQDRIKYF